MQVERTEKGFRVTGQGFTSHFPASVVGRVANSFAGRMNYFWHRRSSPIDGSEIEDEAAMFLAELAEQGLTFGPRYCMHSSAADTGGFRWDLLCSLLLGVILVRLALSWGLLT